MNVGFGKIRYRSEGGSRQGVLIVSEEPRCYCSNRVEMERRLTALVSTANAEGGAPMYNVKKRGCSGELLERLCTAFGMEVYRSGRETAHGVLFESCDATCSIGYVVARDEHFYCNHSLTGVPLSTAPEWDPVSLRAEVVAVVAGLLGDEAELFTMTRMSEHPCRQEEETAEGRWIKNMELVFCRNLPAGPVSDDTARVYVQVRGDSRIALTTLRHPKLDMYTRCSIRPQEEIMKELLAHVASLGWSGDAATAGLDAVRDVKQTYRRSPHKEPRLVPHLSFLLSRTSADGVEVEHSVHVAMAASLA